MKNKSLWSFNGYRSLYQQVLDTVNVNAGYHNRLERCSALYENCYDVLAKAVKENRCFCEIYDEQGNLCLTTKYLRNNNAWEIMKSDDGRVVNSLLSVSAKKSSLRKVDAKGPYVLCFYMKVKGKQPLLINKKLLEDQRLMMNDAGTMYCSEWVFKDAVCMEIWQEKSSEDSYKDSLFLPKVSIR